MNNNQPVTPDELKKQFIEKAAKDADFRRKLIETPREAIEAELSITLPAKLEVRVVEESPNIHYLVLPRQTDQAGVSALTEDELDSVAGGGHHCSCSNSYSPSH